MQTSTTTPQAIGAPADDGGTRPTSRTLWQIGGDVEALEQLLYEQGGDISDEDAERAIDAWLAEAREQESRKLDSYAFLIETTEARAKFRRDRAKKLADLADAETSFVKRLKGRLMAYLDRTRRTRASGEEYEIVVCGNGGAEPLWIDPTARPLVDIPAEHTTTTITITGADAGDIAGLSALYPGAYVETRANPAAIREALGAGAELRYARLQPRGRYVRIK